MLPGTYCLAAGVSSSLRNESGGALPGTPATSAKSGSAATEPEGCKGHLKQGGGTLLALLANAPQSPPERG
jgi:hypothetical protein